MWQPRRIGSCIICLLFYCFLILFFALSKWWCWILLHLFQFKIEICGICFAILFFLQLNIHHKYRNDMFCCSLWSAYISATFFCKLWNSYLEQFLHNTVFSLPTGNDSVKRFFTKFKQDFEQLSNARYGKYIVKKVGAHLPSVGFVAFSKVHHMFKQRCGDADVIKSLGLSYSAESIFAKKSVIFRNLQYASVDIFFTVCLFNAKLSFSNLKR